MAYRSYLTLRRDAEVARLLQLVQALEEQAIAVSLRAHEGVLEFTVAEREERWITIGGLRQLLGRFADVAEWHAPFEAVDTAANSAQRVRE